jgi:hypothetical protein
VYLATERGAQGEQELRALLESRPDALAVPAGLLALAEALRERGDAKAAEEALAELQARFPASPEAGLAEAWPGVRQAALPLRLLPPAPPPGPAGSAAPAEGGGQQAPRKVLVQAGSFRDSENARYLVRRPGCPRLRGSGGGKSLGRLAITEWW